MNLKDIRLDLYCSQEIYFPQCIKITNMQLLTSSPLIIMCNSILACLYTLKIIDSPHPIHCHQDLISWFVYMKTYFQFANLVLDFVEWVVFMIWIIAVCVLLCVGDIMELLPKWVALAVIDSTVYTVISHLSTSCTRGSSCTHEPGSCRDWNDTFGSCRPEILVPSFKAFKHLNDDVSSYNSK